MTHTQINVRMDDELYERFIAEVKHNDTTVSQLARLAIRRYLDGRIDEAS